MRTDEEASEHRGRVWTDSRQSRDRECHQSAEAGRGKEWILSWSLQSGGEIPLTP